MMFWELIKVVYSLKGYEGLIMARVDVCCGSKVVVESLEAHALLEICSSYNLEIFNFTPTSSSILNSPNPPQRHYLSTGVIEKLKICYNDTKSHFPPPSFGHCP